MFANKSLNLGRILLVNVNVRVALDSSAAAPASANPNESRANLKSYDDIPGPKTTPLFGSVLNLKQFGGEYDIMRFRNFQIELQSKYGDLVKCKLFAKKTVYKLAIIFFK